MRENYVQHDPKLQLDRGLLVAALIVTIWISSLVFLLSIDIHQLIHSKDLNPHHHNLANFLWKGYFCGKRDPTAHNFQLSTFNFQLLWIFPAILGRTFIQTGLFIVAHDAIHGSVYSRDRKLNDSIGQFAVTLYALLDYQKLAVNHWAHHRQPGQAGDPDFHDCHSLLWFLKFMKGYLDLRQIAIQFFGLGTVFIVLHFGLHIPVDNLFLFWILPIFFSTMQLFYFGTYLPHRPSNPDNSHHATSSNYPLILSFFSCYHFSYHWEHHEYPWLAWYELPSVRLEK